MKVTPITCAGHPALGPHQGMEHTWKVPLHLLPPNSEVKFFLFPSDYFNVILRSLFDYQVIQFILSDNFRLSLAIENENLLAVAIDFFSCCLPTIKAGIEFYLLIAVLCQYSCGILASFAASAVHGDSLAFRKSVGGLLLEVWFQYVNVNCTTNMPISKLLCGSYVETNYCGVSDSFLIVSADRLL